MFSKQSLSSDFKSQSSFISTGIGLLLAGGFVGFKLFKKHHANATFKEQLKAYYKKYYGEFDLPDSIVNQLSWLQINSVATSESNARLVPAAGSLHVEIKRALARWNCLRILNDFTHPSDSYNVFTAKQPKEDKLSFSTFLAFSALINNLSDSAFKAIKASCFITMTDKAKALATEYEVAFSEDSEKFLTDTITQCPQIYPAWRESEDAKQFMPFVFLKDTHARHMLYTEGYDNMFAELKKRIKDKTISKEQYEVWFARWLINIAGFRGHEQPEGSIYLTQHTAECLLNLKSELDKLWVNPEYDVLTGYLTIRAKNLQVANLFLAHIGSLMRLYTPEEGLELQKWFDSLPTSQQIKYVDEFNQQRQLTQTTSTYEPAILDTLRDLKCSIQERVAIYMQIKSAASELYFKEIKSGIIKASTPLCFRSLALKSNLEPLVEQFRAGNDLTEHFTLQPSGEANFHNFLGCFSKADMDNYISYGQITKISVPTAKILMDAKYIDHGLLKETHVPSGISKQIKQTHHLETKDSDEQQRNIIGLR